MGFDDSVLSACSACSHFTLDSVVDVACIRRNCYRNHTHIDTEQLHNFIFGSDVRSLKTLANAAIPKYSAAYIIFAESRRNSVFAGDISTL